jgi:hypothetical protein
MFPMALIILAKLPCIAWYLPVLLSGHIASFLNLSKLLFIPILSANVDESIQDIYGILPER